MAVTLVIRMAHVVFAIRMLVGATLVVFGLNDLIGLFEVDYGRQGARFLSAMQSTGYLQEVLGSLLMLCGLLFMVARWVPLALVLFAPVMLNILIFHAFLAPEQIAVAAVLGVAQIFLGYCYWPYFRSLFVMNTPSRYGAVRKRSGGGGGGGGAVRPSAPPPQRPPAQRPPAQRPTP